MEYKKSEIAKLLNKPNRTIEFLTDNGIVVPEIEPSPGKGRARLYSESNLIQFAMIDPLKEAGLSLGQIKALFIRVNGLYEGFFTNDQYGKKYEVICIFEMVSDEHFDWRKHAGLSLYRMKRDSNGEFDISRYAQEALFGIKTSKIKHERNRFGVKMLLLGRVKKEGISRINR